MLTKRQVDTAGEGWWSDENCLYLRVSRGGATRRFVFRYRRDGKSHEIGLGGADRVSLKTARELRDKHLEALAKGLDPLHEKRRAAAAKAASHTFGECAKAVIEKREKSWRANPVTGRRSSLADWRKHLMVDAKALAGRDVAEITVEDVKRIIAPYWDAGRHQTARLVLSRIATTLDYAKAHGWRTADNPAAWAIFAHIAPRKPNGKTHHAALDWKAAPGFMASLRALDTMARLALQLIVLTATRSGEAREMRWDELDLERALWRIPGERTKRNIEHVAPLSSDAVALLRKLEAAKRNAFVFAVGRKPVTNAGCWALVKRLTGGAATVHGFRATARSFMADHGMPFDLAEAMLAHSRGSVVEAYQRSQMIELRRPWMQKWANFLAGRDAKVVKLPTRRRA
jgi:integrase